MTLTDGLEALRTLLEETNLFARGSVKVGQIDRYRPDAEVTTCPRCRITATDWQTSQQSGGTIGDERIRVVRFSLTINTRVGQGLSPQAIADQVEMAIHGQSLADSLPRWTFLESGRIADGPHNAPEEAVTLTGQFAFVMDEV